MVPFPPPQSGAPQKSQVIPESPGRIGPLQSWVQRCMPPWAQAERIVTLQRQRGEKCKLLRAQVEQLHCKSRRGKNTNSFLFFLFFKVPQSNSRLESQAMRPAVVFQDLNASPCPQFWQRLSGAVGQTKLHKQTNDKNLKIQEVFRIEGTGVQI